jgi:hypothetical protein
LRDGRSSRAAPGSRSRPARTRTSRRSAALTCSHMPAWFPSRKDRYTVLQVGTSGGSILHGHPLRRTSTIPLTLARRSISCRRPPGLAAGLKGSRIAHFFSVPSEGDARRSLPHRRMMLFLASLSGGSFLFLLFSLGSFSSFCTHSHTIPLSVVQPFPGITVGSLENPWRSERGLV